MLWRIPEPVLFASLVAILSATTGLGLFLGLRRGGEEDERSLTQLTTLQAAVLGLLALLLGFSFQMATTRWEMRKQATIEEANAIGATYLLGSLLPEPQQTETHALMVSYIDARLSSDVESSHAEARARSNAEARRIESRLWELALAADFGDPRPRWLFVDALKAMIGARSKRVALTEDRLPAIVIWVLLAVATVAFGVTGYDVRVTQRARRVTGALVALLLAMLVSLVIVLVMELDNPTRGFIRVSDATLRSLRETIPAR
jgi:hypothetical protein